MVAPNNRLQLMQETLLADIENMQARLPANVEDVSEAFERYARIINMLARALNVMSQLQQQTDKNWTEKADPQNRQALVADIEQKLARLAQSESSPASSDKAE